MELMETSTMSHWVLRYSRRFTTPTRVTRSHSCLPDTLLKGALWGSSRAQSELLQLASRERKFLRPQLLSPDLAIWKVLWGREDHGQAHLWVVNEDEARGKERVAPSDVAGIVRSQSHTRPIHCSFCSAHAFVMPYFSPPHRLLHQGQMKGTMACTWRSDLLELHSLTHLLWGVNGLLKQPFMKMGLLR